MLDDVIKRVSLWREVEPFYPDQTRGLPKTSESRGTESVLNALVLATRDAHVGQPSDDARAAFDNMWALQFRSGDLSGGWAWLNFHNEPWEANDSPYFGAALAAIAVGREPGAYASSCREPGAAQTAARLSTKGNGDAAAVEPRDAAVGVWRNRGSSLCGGASGDRRHGVRQAARRRRLEPLVARPVQARRQHAARYGERRLRDGPRRLRAATRGRRGNGRTRLARDRLAGRAPGPCDGRVDGVVAQ